MDRLEFKEKRVREEVPPSDAQKAARQMDSAGSRELSSLEDAGRGSGGRLVGRPATTSSRNHVVTEQRRRNKINQGFESLKELVPHNGKVDKAGLLVHTVEYVRNVQAVLKELISCGALSTIPEDLQIRVQHLIPNQVPIVVVRKESHDQAMGGTDRAGSGHVHVTSVPRSSIHMDGAKRPAPLPLPHAHNPALMLPHSVGELARLLELAACTQHPQHTSAPSDMSLGSEQEALLAISPPAAEVSATCDATGGASSPHMAEVLSALAAKTTERAPPCSAPTPFQGFRPMADVGAPWPAKPIQPAVVRDLQSALQLQLGGALPDAPPLDLHEPRGHAAATLLAQLIGAKPPDAIPAYAFSASAI